MNWNERLNPDNESEAGCYRFVLAVVLFGFFIWISQITNSLHTSAKIAVVIIILTGGIMVIAIPMARKLQVSTSVSRTQSYVLSLITTTIIFVLFTVFMVGTGLLTNYLKTFLPNWFVNIVWIGTLIILLFSLNRATPGLQKILLRNFQEFP